MWRIVSAVSYALNGGTVTTTALSLPEVRHSSSISPVILCLLTVFRPLCMTCFRPGLHQRPRNRYYIISWHILAVRQQINLHVLVFFQGTYTHAPVTSSPQQVFLPLARITVSQPDLIAKSLFYSERVHTRTSACSSGILSICCFCGKNVH